MPSVPLSFENSLYTPSEWDDILLRNSSQEELNSFLTKSYGQDTVGHELRLNALRAALAGFRENYPELEQAKVFIVRSPARINLRGLHVDTHGGPCNACAIDRELVGVFCCPSEYENDSEPATQVNLLNADSRFPSLSLDLTSLSSYSPSPTWDKYVWSVLSALGRHLEKTSDTNLKVGFKGFISSDVPDGAGLGTSHTLLLGIALGALYSNALYHKKDHEEAWAANVSFADLVLLCQEAEALSGAATGLCDQGSMIFSKAQQLVHACFCNENMDNLHVDYVEWPEDYVFVVADSTQTRNLAGKAASNYAIPRFSYSVSLSLLKEEMRRSGEYPEEFVASLDRLGKVSAENFAEYGGLETIYKLMKKVPHQMTIEDMEREYPQVKETVSKAADKYLRVMPEKDRPKELDLRGALMFGIAECSRARKFYEILKLRQDIEAQADYQGQGEVPLEEVAESISRTEEFVKEAVSLMTIGHAGDSSNVAERLGLNNKVDDERLDQLVDMIKEESASPSLFMSGKGSPSFSPSSLEAQPGDFRASTHLMDAVHSILMESGSLGASLTGAGMGGVVVSVVEKSKAHSVLSSLRPFYQDLSCLPRAFIARPVSGTCVISLA